MADDNYKKKKTLDEIEDETEGESGTSTSTGGGAGGQVEFHGFLLGAESLRDDLLPPEESRRLQANHAREHEGRVKDQKAKLEQLEARKRGDYQGPAQQIREQFSVHPLSNTVQYGSGMTDQNSNPVPNENNAEENPEDRKEQELRYSLQNKPELTETPRLTQTPRFTPK